MDQEIWLVICGVGSESGAGVFRIEEGHYEIGRSSACHIRLLHESVSRHHAMLVNDGGKLSIRDLGSQNGTFVNGRPVRFAQLAFGDSLRIGPVMLDVVGDLFGRSFSEENDEETNPAPVHEPGDAALRAAHFPPVRKQVLVLALQGYANKEIAAELGVSKHTIVWHMKQIFKKLGVRSRAALSAHFRSKDTIPA